MFAEIITIGDELLIGQIVDTNSAWMGQELNKIGIEVLRIVSIRDREKEILEAIDNAMERVNIVLVTGGLGPTKDDITKQTLCKYFHTELVFSEEVFENVKRVLAGKMPMKRLCKSNLTIHFPYQPIHFLFRITFQTDYITLRTLHDCDHQYMPFCFNHKIFFHPHIILITYRRKNKFKP